MSGLFEAIAMDQSQQVVANRKATALAAKRVNERFARFMANADTAEDLQVRWAHIEDDVQGVVARVCEETGGDPQRIATAIKHSFLDGILQGAGNMLHGIGGMIGQGAQGLGQLAQGNPMGGAQDMAQGLGQAAQGGMGALQGLANPGGGAAGAAMNMIGSVHEARKPKLCPYHKEVVDVSLASGDPKSGYEAMASHAWGPNHCDGEYEGSCSFRREMTTQTFWDERQKAIDERREERERQQELDQEQPEQALEPTEDALEPVEDISEGDTDSDSEPALEDVTEPTGVEEAPLAMAASFQRFAPLSEYDKYFGGTPGAAAKAKTAMIEEYGEEKGTSVFYATVNKKKDSSSVRESDATKTINVEQDEGPSPKMDKHNWLPEGVEPVKSEGENSRWPTHKDDLLKLNRPTNNDQRHPEQYKQVGENTTERVDVLKETPPNRADADRHTWPTGETTAVSSVIESLPTRTASIMKDALTAQDFRLLADAIRTAPIDEGARQGVAQHFAEYLGQTNPMFDAERFVAAALGNYNTQRDVFRGQSPGQPAPGGPVIPNDPALGPGGPVAKASGTSQDVFAGNPLIQYLESDEPASKFVSPERIQAALAKLN